MIQGAIFDADGTLLDSMGMWDTVGGSGTWLPGDPPPAQGCGRFFFPMSLTQCAAYLKQTYGLPQSCRRPLPMASMKVFFTFYR